MGIVRRDFGQVSLGSLGHLRNEKEFKRRIGFVPEESFFYSGMTVAEVVAFAARFYSDWNNAVSQHLLQTLDLPEDKRLGQLSKGMRSMVGLLVALSHEPSVLLLDEPTSGLDPRARIATLKLLQQAAHEDGRAVLLATHNLHEVDEIGDRVIVLDRGRILADESLAVLRLKTGAAWSLEHYYLGMVQ